MPHVRNIRKRWAGIIRKTRLELKAKGDKCQNKGIFTL